MTDTEKKTGTKYDVVNNTKGNRVLHDIHGRSVMIEAGQTRSDVELDDETADRLKSAADTGEEVILKTSSGSSDASKKSMVDDHTSPKGPHAPTQEAHRGPAQNPNPPNPSAKK